MTFLSKIITVIVSVAFLCPSVTAAQQVTIALVSDGPSEAQEEVRTVFREELLSVLQPEFAVTIKETPLLQGDWTKTGAESAVDAALDDREVDLVIAQGVLASNEFCCRTDLQKPVIAPFIIDIELQGVAFDGGASGQRNLSYLAHSGTVRRELTFLRDEFGFTSIDIIGPKVFRDDITSLERELNAVTAELNMAYAFVAFDDGPEAAVQNLTPGSDAAYVLPLLQSGPEEIGRLFALLAEGDRASFAFLGRPYVELGALMGLGPEQNIQRIARRVALNAQRILSGEPAAEIPVTYRRNEELVLNMETARQIGLDPTFDLMTRATLINETAKTVEVRWNLQTAVQEAVRVNRDIAAERRRVEGGAEEIRLAQSNLLPQLNANLNGQMIDDDRAASLLSGQAEQTVLAGGSLSQVIYAESVWANLTIQRRLQAIRELELRILELDIALSASQAYLNVLRAQTLLQIEKENLDLTQSNLEIAQVRERIGVSGLSDVYRFEANEATNRQAVLNAQASLEQAQFALNQLLNRPSAQRFELEAELMEEEYLLATNEAITGFIVSEGTLARFESFMVTRGLVNAPEIMALDEAILSQERALLASRRSFWAPDIALQADLTHVLETGGEGSDVELPATIPPDVGALLGEIPDDTSWSVGIGVTLPLFEGGARRAERTQAEIEVQRLGFEREAARQKIEQRIRSAIRAASASFFALDLTQRAADAAALNLELVEDAYSRGATGIIELLDAQTAAQNANSAAANAEFEFLLDAAELNRATSEFSVLMTPEELQAWNEDFQAFTAQ